MTVAFVIALAAVLNISAEDKPSLFFSTIALLIAILSFIAMLFLGRTDRKTLKSMDRKLDNVNNNLSTMTAILLLIERQLRMSGHGQNRRSGAPL